MIKPPSLQFSYSFVWSKDPALNLPEDPAEAERVIRVARQTGQYPIADGQQPTVFHIRQLHRTDMSWIYGESQHSTEHGRVLSGMEVDDLTVRLALESIDNFGAHKLERRPLGSQRRVVTPDTINALHGACGEWGNHLIAELAQFIVARVSGVIDPL